MWISITCIRAPSQHVHEAHFVLRRLLFVQPSLDPLHCVSVGTHRVWTRCVGVIGHAGKLVAALAKNPHLSVSAYINDGSVLSNFLRGSRHGALDDLLI